MDTTNLNNTPTSGGGSEKTEKLKKAAGKVTQFTAATGLGVAGTMAANTMTTHDEESNDELFIETTPSMDYVSNEVVPTESVTEFDPNEIMIDPEEVNIIYEPQDITEQPQTEQQTEDMAFVEPLPITEENNVSISTESPLVAEDVPTGNHIDEINSDYVVEVMYGGPDFEPLIEDDILPEDLLDDNILANNEIEGDTEIGDSELAEDILS